MTDGYVGVDAGASREGPHPSRFEGHTCSVLTQRWVGRGTEIQSLLAHFGTPNTAMRPVLVYGGPATGKTAVVK